MVLLVLCCVWDIGNLPCFMHAMMLSCACVLCCQAIGLLDDLDKELNTYAMRVREWYGWHFPEMTKIVADNIAYAKAVRVTPSQQQRIELLGWVCD